MSNIYYEILILKLCSKTKIQKNILKERYIFLYTPFLKTYLERRTLKRVCNILCNILMLLIKEN